MLIMSQYTNIIARADVKNKILDIRDKLSPSTVENFAAIIGHGGSSGSYNACFALYLCDYSKGKGNASKTVSFNIDVVLAELLYEAAKQFAIGNSVQRSGESDTMTVPADMTEKANAALRTARTVLKNGVVSEDGETITVRYDGIVEIGKRLKQLCDLFPQKAASANSASANNASAAPADVEFSRYKLNIYKESGGYAPVSRLLIRRQPDRKMPWYVSIQNGTGKVNKTQIGGFYYSGEDGEFKETDSAFINIDDTQMFTLMSAAMRTLRIYEDTFCATKYKNGRNLWQESVKAESDAAKGGDAAC